MRLAVCLFALTGCVHAQPAEVVEPNEYDRDVMRTRWEDPRAIAQREDQLYLEAPFLLVDLAQAAVSVGDFEAAADHLRQHRSIAGANAWRERAPYSIAVACARGNEKAARALIRRYARSELGFDQHEPGPATEITKAHETDAHALPTIDPFPPPKTVSPFRDLPPSVMFERAGLADCAAMIDEVYAELEPARH